MNLSLSEFSPLRSSANTAVYTCITCQIAFISPEKQRHHHRTDWHKYNLKRKVAGLFPIDAEQFAQKVLAQQAKIREEQEREGSLYACNLCQKSYSSENALHSHMQSRKHKQLQRKSLEQTPWTVKQPEKYQLFSDQEEDEAVPTNDMSAQLQSSPDPGNQCLFCAHPSASFDANLKHMQVDHGFFLPDYEYLVDPKGLILYLEQKIVRDHYCLYCNGRGRTWKSAASVQMHMIEKGHCKMAYDDSEDPEELLKFYNFGTPCDKDRFVVSKQELILEGGVRLGHRQFFRLFKQRLRPDRNSDSDSNVIDKDAIEHSTELTRKEKRRLLAGKSVVIRPDRACGDKRVCYPHQINNTAATLRARAQVPI